MKTNPMRIPGRWREGYVLDYHTMSSAYVGDDEYGHPQFETTRSEMGELLYRLKYRNEVDMVEKIAQVAMDFLTSWKPPVTVLVPVPPTRPRRQQPVLLLAEAIGEKIGIPARPKGVVRIGKAAPELKNVYSYDDRIRLLDGAHRADASVLSGQTVLIFDDLYRSGATMNAITAALYDAGGVADVYALALTRTRSRG